MLKRHIPIADIPPTGLPDVVRMQCEFTLGQGNWVKGGVFLVTPRSKGAKINEAVQPAICGLTYFCEEGKSKHFYIHKDFPSEHFPRPQI